MESLTKAALLTLGLNVVRRCSLNDSIVALHTYLCAQIVVATTNDTANLTTMVPESGNGGNKEARNLIDNFLGDLLKYAGKKSLSPTL